MKYHPLVKIILIMAIVTISFIVGSQISSIIASTAFIFMLREVLVPCY